jgi:hypothetical protein
VLVDQGQPAGDPAAKRRTAVAYRCSSAARSCIVVSLVILIAGLRAIRSLSVRQFHCTDVAVVEVTTAYIGASADLVPRLHHQPAGRVIASADGIDYIESSSAANLARSPCTCGSTTTSTTRSPRSSQGGAGAEQPAARGWLP